MTKIPKIAFIGLGIMGEPMAKNMIAKGFDVAVCDVSTTALQNFDDLNCTRSSEPGEAAAGRDVIITMLATSDIVSDVLFGENGALHSAAPDSLVIEMSTGSYPQFMDIAKAVHESSHRIIDAPVGRSPREAVSGNLLVMAGGANDDVSNSMPIFEAVGDTIIHVGPLGDGLKTKLVNNYMSMVNHVLTGEVLAFAHKIDLDVNTTVEVLSTTSAGRGQLLTNFPKKVLAGDTTPDFPIWMGIKDLRMALELADLGECEGKFGKLSRDLFIAAEEKGMGKLDCTAILNFLKDHKI
jgi:4-hydroxybutyrate dehydrogenase/sulfolactaldehyde 3-reductase